MGTGAKTPCWSCGVEMPAEHTRCLKCGTVKRASKLDELDTVPGAPLIRVGKKQRISHRLIPVSLRQEYEETARDREIRGVQVAEDRRNKFFWACGAGAALTGLPLAVPGFLFMPMRTDAFFLTILDLVIGALAGFLTLRLRGGIFQALVVFAAGFAAAVSTKIKVGYPVQHQPAAILVLASAVFLSLLVAGSIGAALDEHDSA